MSGAGGGTNAVAPARTIVGYADAGFFTPYHAFRWTAATGAVDLGTLDTPNNATRLSFATGISEDGTVVVGYSQLAGGGGTHAFRWTQSGAMVDLGAPAGASRDSRALDVSAAGDVVVGEAVFVDAAAFTGFRSGAFRWTQAGGFQSLGALEPGYFSVATAVTADGSTIVGQGGIQVVVGNSSTNGSRAFRWTATTGLQAMGPLAGHTHAAATGVSDNGRIVVGVSSAGPLRESTVSGYELGSAFRWTQATGIQDLQQVMVTAGVNMTGVTLRTADGISPDGQLIFGRATTAAGEVSYFVKFCDANIGGACIVQQTAPTPDFTLTGSAALSVVAGRSVSLPLTITPNGGFTQAVSFACSGLPTGAACSFSPATVTPSGAAANTTLTITTAGSAMVPQWDWPSGPGTLFVAAVVLLLALAMVRSPASGRERRWRPVAIVPAVLLFALSCGGGDSDGGTTTPPPPATGTPAGNYAITVTATSGSGTTALTRTITVPLTVTR